MPSDKRSLSVLSTLVLLHGLPPLDLSLKHPLTEKLRQNCLNITDRQYFPNDMTMLHNLPDLVVELGVADLSALQFACDLKSLFFISCQDAITTVITTIIITVTMIMTDALIGIDIRLHLPVMSASSSARASLSFSFLQETNQEKYNICSPISPQFETSRRHLI